MSISRSESWTEALVIEPKNLRTLVKTLIESYPNITYKASCSDKNERRFTSLDLLAEYGNPSHAAIESLRIHGMNTETFETFTIEFNNSNHRNVRFSFESEESRWQTMTEAFQTFIDAAKPLYRFFAKRDWAFLVWTFFTILLFVIPQYNLLRLGKPLAPFYDIRMASFGWGTVILFSLMGAIAFSARVITKRCFPMLAFCIGNGALRHKKLATIQTTVIAGIFISLVGTALYNLIVQGRL